MNDPLKVNAWCKSVPDNITQDWARGVSNPFQPVALSLFKNVRRLDLLPLFPASMFIEGIRYERADFAARMILTGQPMNGPGGVLPIMNTTKYRKLHADLLSGAVRKTDFPINVGKNVLTVYNQTRFPEMYETLMSLQLISAWTVFETTAGDLWKAAVNNYPMVFLRMDGNPKRIAKLSAGKTDEEDISGVADRGKSILLSDIAEVTNGTYEMTGKWGQIMARGFNFTTLAGIRRAYSIAFSEKVKKARTNTIDASVGHVSLDALAAVRNLLAHKAGIVDQEYLDAVKRIPILPRATEKSSLPVNGELCQTLLDSALASCKNLIDATYKWVQLAGGNYVG